MLKYASDLLLSYLLKIQNTKQGSFSTKESKGLKFRFEGLTAKNKPFRAVILKDSGTHLGQGEKYEREAVNRAVA